MKKLSKRQRAKAKEKELRKQANMEKAGIPYSKHRIRLCQHYKREYDGLQFLMRQQSILLSLFPDKKFYTVKYQSLLSPVSKMECECSFCKKKFSAQSGKKVDKLISAANRTSTPERHKKYEEKIQQMIPPVKYYYLESDEIKIVE